MRTAVLLAVLVGSTVLAQDGNIPGTEPVPLELLKGRSLVLESGNCTTDAPPGFEWLASPGMTEKHPEVRMFLCRDSKQTQIFMLQVYDKVFAQLDGKGMEEFLNGAKGSMEQQGWKFQKTDFKPTRMPIEGSSYRFEVQLLRKDGQTLYWIGYVTTAQRMYCLSSMQLENGERPDFNSFVKSFRLLKPVQSPGKVGSLLPYFALSFIVGSVVVFINSRRQKKAGEEEGGEAGDEKVAKDGKPSKPARAAKDDGLDAIEDDEDDETDAFKVKPIVPTKGRTRRDVAAPAPEKSRTRRDERPAREERSDRDRPRERRDERPAREERSDRDRPRERRDERSDRDRPREKRDERSDRDRPRERERRDEKPDRERRRERKDEERPFG